VLHSPTPSTVRIAASSNGLGKKALAAWLSWWSVKSSGAVKAPGNSRRITCRMKSFFLSQTGIAVLKLGHPPGA
jgi:hypothetical protein